MFWFNGIIPGLDKNINAFVFMVLQANESQFKTKQNIQVCLTFGKAILKKFNTKEPNYNVSVLIDLASALK